MITIHSIRYGFATNSSSSHSILLLRDKSTLIDHLSTVRDGDFSPPTEMDAPFCYGWGNFACVGRQAKLDYIAVQIAQSAQAELQLLEPSAVVYARGVLESLFPGAKVLEGVSALDAKTCHIYVDHQSLWMLPVARQIWPEQMHGLDLYYLKDLIEYLLSDERIIIVGGHDDREKGKAQLRDSLTGRVLKAAPKESSRDESTWWARKDNGVWTVFAPGTGRKLRFSFGTTDAPTKASAPELVDLKITDMCNQGCEYCYQDSRPSGCHADYYNYNYNNIDHVLRELRALEVFEVALGGGEPTLHPKFWDILEFCRGSIVPNFSTRQTDWLHNPEKVKIVSECCGAVAFSVRSYEEVRALVKLCERVGLVRIAFQYILGVGSANSIIAECLKHSKRCTLLGYKSVGRGKMTEDSVAAMQRDFDFAKRTLKKELSRGLIGMDTVAAKLLESELKELGVDPRSYETVEGKFSMYIDAVNRKMGPSSFEPEKLVDFPEQLTADAIREAFARW